MKKDYHTYKRRRKPGELPASRAAIRNHCLECMGWESDPRTCPDTSCWLWLYRLGCSHRPEEALQEEASVQNSAGNCP